MSARTSLRHGLIWRLVPALAAIGLVGVIAAYSLGYRYATLAYDRALFESVVALAGQIALRNGELQVNLPPEARKLLVASSGEAALFRVVDLRSGKVVVANGDLGPLPDDAPIPGQPSFRDARIGATPFRVAYAAYLIDIEDVPALVEVAETLGKRNRVTHQILAATVLLVATILAAAVALVWQGVGRALAPLKLLEAEAAERSGTNLTPLNADAAPEEVRGLIGSINRMMGRVSDSIDSQRRFIANAAHQLRTPISGLRLQAQLALKKETPSALRAHVCEIDETAGRAGHLIEQMLSLSKAEAKELVETGRQVDLTRVAYAVIGRYLSQALEKDIDLGYQGMPDGAHIAGNEVLLAELVANLVDNAIRYGRPGGRVTVSVRAQADAVLLTVVDDGPGISNEEQGKMFQRFHRAESSAAQGAGLGLAIVKEIADRHQGEVSVDAAPGLGCRFVVRFPRIALSEIPQLSPQAAAAQNEELALSGENARRPAGAEGAVG